MKLFRNPVFAVILAIVVVIASTILNTDIKFGRECRRVSEQFYADTSRSAEPCSISEGLVSISSDTDTLVGIAARYGVDCSALNESNTQLREGLGSRLNASTVYVSYSRLSAALTALIGQLANAALSEEDRAEVTRCADAIAEAQGEITLSGYNSTVRAFQHRYDRFPTNLLAKLAGVAYPEAFS